MLPLVGFFDKFRRKLSPLMKTRRVRRGLAAVLFFILITLIVSVNIIPQKVNLQVGQVSQVTIYAPHSVTYEDKDKTREARERAAEGVENQYKLDPQVSVAVKKDISDLIATIGKIQSDTMLGEEEKVKRLREVIPFTLPNGILVGLARSSPGSLKQVETAVVDVISGVMDSRGVTTEELEETRDALAVQVRRLGFKEPYVSLAEGIVRYFLRPNKFFDAERTSMLKKAAMDAVPPVMVSIKKGEKVIGEGEIVTEEHMNKLAALGLTHPSPPVKSILGSALLVALLMVVVLFYLYQQNREIYQNSGHLYLLGIIVTTVLLVSKAVVAIKVSPWPEFETQLGYAAPIAAGGMLIAILLDSRLGVLVVAIMSFLLGLMTGGQIQFAMVGLIGGITGVYGVSKLSQRGDMARAGVYVSVANIASILTMGLIMETPTGLVISSALTLGIVNGILSSILTIGVLPYLESSFGITSSVRLLELSHPSNPLLKRLLTEAPGTYHHSIMVANLAEAAAEAVGGEALLARVGSYYHDIGKIKRPYFFIENQVAVDNPHDKIAPSLSTLILTSHTKDGVEIAREHKLPQAIIDIIEQHHGTGVCTYFYHKALENGHGEYLDEDEFRYEGPKPQTKEAAIVMLADSVEAAVRSLPNRAAGRVEGLIRKIIKDKLMDGQLDECDLTLKDLDTIANAFLKSMSGIFHSRIEYPNMAQEMERRKVKRAGGRNKQSARRGAV